MNPFSGMYGGAMLRNGRNTAAVKKELNRMIGSLEKDKDHTQKFCGCEIRNDRICYSVYHVFIVPISCMNGLDERGHAHV